MELLTHLFYFLLCSALIVIAWFVFLFFNNLIDKMPRGIIQGFCGTLNTVVLLAIVGIFASLFALSLFAGIMFVMIAIFLIYSVKKAIPGLASAKN